MKPSSEPLSLHEAAARLGVHYMTVYRHVRLGLLPARREAGGWRVLASDVEALRRRAPVPPDAPAGRRTAPWAQRLKARLLDGDEAGAWAVFESVLTGGAEPAAVYRDVLVPAMRAIGDDWAAGLIDVQQEHRSSTVAMRLISRLGPRFVRRGRRRGTVVIGTPPGERHSLPCSILADLYRGGGFEVVDLGADLPINSFVDACQTAVQLRAVAVSISTSTSEAAASATVAGRHDALGEVAVLLGGGAVRDDGHARELGADGWAPDGEGAVGLVLALRTATGRGGATASRTGERTR